MTLLQLENVSKEYRLKGETVRVLKGIDLQIASGEFMALMGPSGSGKTTLLHLIGAVDRPTGGRIFFDGQETSALSASQLSWLRLHRLGFIFQSYNLLPAMTVWDNLAYPLILQGVSHKERTNRIEAMISKVGLGHRLKHRPEDLSGGEQQRVAIARALITHPLVVLADEPTAHLDAETGQEIIALLRRLNKEEKITFVFATHDAAILGQSERVLRLRGGQIMNS